MGAKEVWVPISSTNTRRFASMRPSSSRHRLLKNSSRSRAPLVLFFGSCADDPPLGRPSPRSLRPRTRHKGTRPSANGWPKGALGGPLRAASSPSRRASVSCLGPSSAPRCRAPREACSSVLRWRDRPRSGGRSRPWGHAFLHRLDDLLCEVKRTCTHASLIAGAPSSQSAVRGAVGAGVLAFPSPAVLGGAPAVAATSFARVPPFTVALPIPVKARLVGANTYHIAQRQTRQTLHPWLGKTTVWGYDDGRHGPLYPGPTIEVRRGTPTTVRYEDRLPRNHLLPVDTS